MPETFIVDSESVRGLAKLLEETGLSEIEYQVGTQRIRVVKAGQQATIPHYVPAAAAAPAPDQAPKAEEPSKPAGDIIPSPMVGTAYLASEPGADPFVKAGDTVKKGDTLLIVEAMKVMNPIRAPRDGKILEICVADGNPVEFEEPLIILA